VSDAFITNYIPGDAGSLFWTFFSMLTSAGWTIKGSGDGLSAVNLTGNTFTNAGASGAHGYNNNLAWIRLQDPGAGREIVVQTDGAGGARITYSPSAKFVTGGTATVQPSASDQQLVCGTGSNAAPTMVGFWPNNVASSQCKVQAGARGTAPYGFWVAGADTPAGASTFAFFMDPITGASAADPDPVVWGFAAGYQYSGSQCLCFMDVPKTAWQPVAQCSYNVGATAIEGSGGALNPFTGLNDGAAVWYYRVATPNPGRKGWSSLFRFTEIPRTNYLDTGANLTWITVGSYFVFWNGVTTPTN
jgi:hypothetical protein